MKIIIDAMGGDNAPRAVVEGAVLAVREFGEPVTLVGDRAQIEPLLREFGAQDDARIETVHAPDVITMEDDAVQAVRKKRDSSLVVALSMLGKGEGDALISAGSTGAVLAGGTLLVKRIRGIRRAALAPILPTAKGGSLLIDCGANVDCTAEYLLQFAFLGHYYAKRQMGIESPRIGLINNGAEETKGTDTLREAHALLRAASEQGKLNFVGNIEGRDIPLGAADVLVCDGFTGNVVLKTVEGVGMFFVGKLKGIFKKNLLTKLAALAVKPGLREFKKMLDYKEIGGAPLLGISRPIIKAHGSCDAYAVRSAVSQAIVYVRSGMIAEIEAHIDDMVQPPAEAQKTKEENE